MLSLATLPLTASSSHPACRATLPPAHPHSLENQSPMGQSLSHMAQIIDRKSQSPGGKHGHLWAIHPGRAGTGPVLGGHPESLPSLECVAPVKASQPPPQ